MSQWKRHVQLTLFKTYAELKSESAKTYLGIVWWVLDPIIYMSVFYVVFAVLLESRSGDFVSFLLVGLVAWQLFASTVNNCALSILGGRGLMQQVAFPKAILPLSVFLGNLFKFSIVFLLLLVFLWWRGYPPDPAYWWLPIVLAVHLSLALAAGLVVSALVPLAPDIRNLISHGVQMMFFLSGIFYSVHDIPIDKRQWLYCNPMVSVIESYRAILIEATEPNLTQLRFSALVAAALILAAVLLLSRFEHRYASLTRIV